MCFINNPGLTLTGEVAYEVHTSGNLLEQINSAISQEVGVVFEGVWLLVVYWNNVTNAQSLVQASCLQYYNPKSVVQLLSTLLPSVIRQCIYLAS